MLRVRIAEVQRNVLKQFGINTQGAVLDRQVRLQSAEHQSVLDAASSVRGGYGGSYCERRRPELDMRSSRAMERDGLLRTLAEPTLTAISGESAKFLAGGEFPIPVAGDDNEVTIEFKPFGVGLGFTPVVMSEGRISLKINTEVSEISTENCDHRSTSSSSIPALNVRRAETTVELPSGGSMAHGRPHQGQSCAPISPARLASRICRSSARCSAAAISSRTRPSSSSS